MRTTLNSGYAFEDTFGYARAVRVGTHVYVSGTTARGAALEGDAETQAVASLEIIAAALEEIGSQLRHVVRTVLYVTSLQDVSGIARAHRKFFGDISPASTVVEVRRLLPSGALVEIEATAFIDDIPQNPTKETTS